MSETRTKPGRAMKTLIVVALAVVVGAIVVAKNASNDDADTQTVGRQAESQSADEESAAPSDRAATADADSLDPDSRPLPKLVDLGAKSCVPCKMMAPILEELRNEYKGKFDVVFIDVWENKSAGEPYDIRMIPTQIFFDAEGKELFRHEGFYSKEDILGKWKELGVDFDEAADKDNAAETAKRGLE